MAVGFANTLVMLFSGASLPVFGFLLDVKTKVSPDVGLSDYTIADFRYALAIIPVCLILSTILALFIKESHPNSRQIIAEEL